MSISRVSRSKKTETQNAIHIRRICPSRQVRVIHTTFRANMLTRPNYEVPSSNKENHRGLVRVRVRNPYSDGKAVSSAPEAYWQSTFEYEK